jgi:hypothetical protein
MLIQPSEIGIEALRIIRIVVEKACPPFFDPEDANPFLNPTVDYGLDAGIQAWDISAAGKDCYGFGSFHREHRLGRDSDKGRRLTGSTAIPPQ